MLGHASDGLFLLRVFLCRLSVKLDLLFASVHHFRFRTDTWRLLALEPVIHALTAASRLDRECLSSVNKSIIVLYRLSSNDAPLVAVCVLPFSRNPLPLTKITKSSKNIFAIPFLVLNVNQMYLS